VSPRSTDTCPESYPESAHKHAAELIANARKPHAPHTRTRPAAVVRAGGKPAEGHLERQPAVRAEAGPEAEHSQVSLAAAQPQPQPQQASHPPPPQRSSQRPPPHLSPPPPHRSPPPHHSPPHHHLSTLAAAQPAAAQEAAARWWQHATRVEMVQPASQPQPQPRQEQPQEQQLATRADGEAATASSWPLFGTAGAVLALALVATVLVLPQRLRHPLRRALLADDEGEYQLAE